jgi:hypothetical protein
MISSSSINYVSISWTQFETVPFQNPSSFYLVDCANEQDPKRSKASSFCSSFELQFNYWNPCSIRLKTCGLPVFSRLETHLIYQGL